MCCINSFSTKYLAFHSWSVIFLIFIVSISYTQELSDFNCVLVITKLMNSIQLLRWPYYSLIFSNASGTLTVCVVILILFLLYKCNFCILALWFQSCKQSASELKNLEISEKIRINIYSLQDLRSSIVPDRSINFICLMVADEFSTFYWGIKVS